MGLKVNSCVRRIVHFNWDKIRPKWDWKEEKKVGTESMEDKTDKIRPKWDWKSGCRICAVSDLQDKIRPKWDWKVSV